MKHELKTWSSVFQAVWDGKKTFEWRKNDRDYQEGDELILKEYYPHNQAYTGRSIECDVTYKAEGAFGIPEGYCVLAIRVTNKRESREHA